MAVFEPTRPVTTRRLVLAFLLGALVWLAAGVLAVVLLGHSYILRSLLLAVAVSWAVFGLALLGAIALRRREEREPPPPPRTPPSPPSGRPSPPSPPSPGGAV
ncbi:hypothetical protein ACIBI4_13885 [Streptomyces sp. NPDC050418]|uniref:hypothetical protein n=1 Tax=Streptomyces sp. NPDC050418 TaxID=3365612 RepID=UPI0037882A04